MMKEVWNLNKLLGFQNTNCYIIAFALTRAMQVLSKNFKNCFVCLSLGNFPLPNYETLQHKNSEDQCTCHYWWCIVLRVKNSG